MPSQGYGIAVMSNVGLGLAPVDSEVIAHGIVEVLNGRMPETDERIDAIVDGVTRGGDAAARGGGDVGRGAGAGLGRAPATAASAVRPRRPAVVPAALLLAGLGPILRVVFAAATRASSRCFTSCRRWLSA